MRIGYDPVLQNTAWVNAMTLRTGITIAASTPITVVDASRVQFTSMDQAGDDDAVCVIGLQVHILTAGATFNLHTREASPGSLLARSG